MVLLAAPGLRGASEQTYRRGVAYVMLAVLGISVSNVLLEHVAGRTAWGPCIRFETMVAASQTISA